MTVTCVNIGISMDQKTTLSDRSLLYTDLKKGYQLRFVLSEVTKGLQLYEKISVIFLLCETAHAGLAIIETILHKDVTYQNYVLYKWLREQVIFMNEDWQNNLAELLAILQNFRLAKLLNFTKKELCQKFRPKDNLKTYNISCVRKVLYNLCEELKPDECSQLIKMFETQNLIDPFKIKYLEYQLLSWSEKGILHLGNEKMIDLEALVKCLESFNLKNLTQDIEIIVAKTNCEIIKKKYSSKLESELSEYYEIIDEKKLGLCVIINEKNFSSGLFPKRWGSEKDVERLTEVFSAFGFDIKFHSDLPYDKLMKTLRFYAKTVDKNSSFFTLIILSHGSENVIFTSDSLPVDMNAIEMIFQAETCPNLIGKPKIFIIQSCQGQKWQKVVQDLNLQVETDNVGVSVTQESVLLGPQRGDSVIAWSTVQGFASFRDKYNGSWYIQELCNELWKFGDAFDLVEVFTRVNNNLRSKVYNGQFMVPSLLLSLRAKVKFPSLKENFSLGKQLMLERLIFEKLYKEFLNVCQFIKSGFFQNVN